MSRRLHHITRVTLPALVIAGIAVPTVALGAATAAAASCGALTAAQLPHAISGVPYSQQIQISGGAAPYQFSNAVGLPGGLPVATWSLSAKGALSGVSVITNTDNAVDAYIQYDVTDAAGCTQRLESELVIDSPSSAAEGLLTDLSPITGPLGQEIDQVLGELLCPNGVCPIR